MLWNQQHWSYLHYVLIPSEPQHFCFDKHIPEALPLLEAPPAVRSVHLYKLLCGVTFDRSHLQVPRNRPTYFGHYGELHQAHVLLLINKKDGSLFGLVTRSDGARHLRNSVRELSDQASCFPKYKVAISLYCWCIAFYHKLTQALSLRRRQWDKHDLAGYWRLPPEDGHPFQAIRAIHRHGLHPHNGRRCWLLVLDWKPRRGE